MIERHKRNTKVVDHIMLWQLRPTGLVLPENSKGGTQMTYEYITTIKLKKGLVHTFLDELEKYFEKTYGSTLPEDLTIQGDIFDKNNYERLILLSSPDFDSTRILVFEGEENPAPKNGEDPYIPFHVYSQISSKCPHCFYQPGGIDKDWKFCPKCGSAIIHRI